MEGLLRKQFVATKQLDVVDNFRQHKRQWSLGMQQSWVTCNLQQHIAVITNESDDSKGHMIHLLVL